MHGVKTRTSPHWQSTRMKRKTPSCTCAEDVNKNCTDVQTPTDILSTRKRINTAMSEAEYNTDQIDISNMTQSSEQHVYRDADFQHEEEGWYMLTRLSPRILGRILNNLDAHALSQFAGTCIFHRSVVDVVVRACADFKQKHVLSLDNWRIATREQDGSAALDQALDQRVRTQSLLKQQEQQYTTNDTSSVSTSAATALTPRTTSETQVQHFRKVNTRPFTRARLEDSLSTLRDILTEDQSMDLLELATFVGKVRPTSYESPYAAGLNLCGNISLSPLALSHVPLSVLEIVMCRIRHTALFWNHVHSEARLNVPVGELYSGGNKKGDGDKVQKKTEGQDDDKSQSETDRHYHMAWQNVLNMLVDAFADQFQICSKVIRLPGDMTARVNPPNTERNTLLSPQHIHSLNTHGFAVVDGFINQDLSRRVFKHANMFATKTNKLYSISPEELDKMDEPPPFFMMPGQPASARGDSLLWLKDNMPPTTDPHISEVYSRFDQLREVLSADVALLSGGKETQLAMYPGDGTGYHRHRDAYPDDGMVSLESSNNRRLTAICYCTQSWTHESGGKLRLWLSSSSDYDVVDVEPIPGRLVLFLSGLLDHSVMPSFAPRVAMTTWYW